MFIFDKSKIELRIHSCKDNKFYLQYRKDYSKYKYPKWVKSILKYFNYWHTPHYFKSVDITPDTDVNDCLSKVYFDSFEEFEAWYNYFDFETFGELYRYFWTNKNKELYNLWVNRWRMR